MSVATATGPAGALTEPPVPISAADAALAEREQALPGLAALLDEAVFTTLLDEAYPEAGVRCARARYLRLKPSTNCLVAFEVEASAGATRVYARTHPRADADKLARVNEARAVGPLGRGGVLVEERLVALYPFPNDRRMPVLPRLFEDEARARLLATALGGDSAVASASLGVVRHKPERRFVGVLEAPDGERAVVKAYDRDWPRASRAAATVHSRSHLRVPRHLGGSAAERVLVTEWLPGEPLDAFALVKGGAGGAATAAGRALAELHTHPPESLPCGTGEGKAAGLADAARAVGALCPRADRAARELAERLGRRLAVDPARASGNAIVHGDFSADQMLAADDGEVSMIDLDDARRGDPAADLGSFLARLELDLLEERLPATVASELGEGLLAGYEDARGSLPHGVREHTAAALLRLAPEPFRHRRIDWPELLEAALERARELEGAAPALGLSRRERGRR